MMALAPDTTVDGAGPLTLMEPPSSMPAPWSTSVREYTPGQGKGCALDLLSALTTAAQAPMDTPQT
jgi:hypothetical protein